MRTTFLGAIVVISGLTLSSTSDAGNADGKPGATELTTQRNVRGVITAVDGGLLTIQAGRSGITGRIDPKKTRIYLGNAPAKASDLQLSSVAQAELTLDDVWETVRVAR